MDRPSATVLVLGPMDVLPDTLATPELHVVSGGNGDRLARVLDQERPTLVLSTLEPTRQAAVFRQVGRLAPEIARVALLPPDVPLPRALTRLTEHITTLPPTLTRWHSALDRALGGDGLVHVPHRFDTASLPALPEHVQDLLYALEQPDTSMGDAGRLLEDDPGLSASVLALANSAWYGLPRRIASVQEAALHLGARTLRLAVLTCHVFEAFGDGGDAANRLRDRGGRRVRLARALFPEARDDAITAALLLDAGSLLLLSVEPEHLARTPRSAGHRKAVQIDTAYLGVDRDLLGAELLARWQLPHSVVRGVAHGRVPFPHPLDPDRPEAVAWLAEATLQHVEGGPEPEPAWLDAAGLLTRWRRVRDELGNPAPV